MIIYMIVKEKKVSALIPPESLKEFKALCVENDVKMSDVIREAIEKWCKEKGGKKSGK